MYKRLLFFMIVFVTGWLSHMVAVELSSQQPVDLAGLSENRDKASPVDRIDETQIHVYDSHIVLELQNASWARFTDTHSMEPVLDSSSNGIEITPTSEEQIEVGDIIAYESEFSQGTIIHRIIEKSSDDQGTYFILKGDNNAEADPGKIRFSQIKRVLVGILY